MKDSIAFWKSLNLNLGPNNRKRFIGFVITSFLLLLPHFLSPACIYIDRSFHGYSFVNLELLDASQKVALAPLFYKFDKLYENYFKTVEEANRNENLAEWHERFCSILKTEDLAYIIYKSPIEELELLKRATQSKSLPVPSQLQDNEFAHYLWRNKCIETIEYLQYAKKCEPFVVTNDAWQALPRDKEQMQGLITEGRRQFRKTGSHYIRLRYAYQIIRLAHYSGDYQQTLALNEELLPQVDKKLSRWNESIIPWWILGHKAGALRKLGQNVEASYFYTLIFQNCPGRRASAYQSFFIKNDQEWDACLRLCQSDDERATLFAIRAANSEGRALEDMKRIYELDPQNPNLEILLVQEVRKMERNLLGLDFNDKKEHNRRYYNVPRPYAGSYVIDLQEFVRLSRKEGKVKKPELWHIAEGYLEFLSGNYYDASRTLKDAASGTGDEMLREQIDAINLAITITSLSKPDEQTEDFAYTTIRDNKLYQKYSSFADYLRDRLTALYKNAKQEGKAFLSNYRVADLKANPKVELANDFLALTNKPEKTSFERMLLQKLTTNDVLDIIATAYLSRGEVEAALEIFKRIPANNWDDYGQFDPFKDLTKDCVNCFQRRDTSVILALNKSELLEQLIDLEYKAKSDIENSAKHYYKLGLAYYNMSYFGYDWKAMDYFRSGSTWPRLHTTRNQEFSHPRFKLGNRENTDLSKAYACFEKARILAKDPELAAKAAFQSARCEQKFYFMSTHYQPELCCNRIPRIPSEYLVGFSALRTNYSNTDFYKMIIKECKYFAAYTRR